VYNIHICRITWFYVMNSRLTKPRDQIAFEADPSIIIMLNINKFNAYKHT